MNREEWNAPLREWIVYIFVFRLTAPPESVKKGIEEGPNEASIFEKTGGEDGRVQRLKASEIIADQR